MTSPKNIEPLHNTFWNDHLEWERNTGKPFFKILNGTNFFLAHHLKIERERSHAVPIAGDLEASATGKPTTRTGKPREPEEPENPENHENQKDQKNQRTIITARTREPREPREPRNHKNQRTTRTREPQEPENHENQKNQRTTITTRTIEKKKRNQEKVLCDKVE